MSNQTKVGFVSFADSDGWLFIHVVTPEFYDKWMSEKVGGIHEGSVYDARSIADIIDYCDTEGISIVKECNIREPE